ncbi:fasciclin domain-containing protein [soil metagenome]
MRRFLLPFLATVSIATASIAQTTPGRTPLVPPEPATNAAIGGIVLDRGKLIAEDISLAPTLTTFVTALQATDLATTLAGTGPFTVFAPTNDAFARLAPGTIDNLLKPENKATLTKLLGYHIVPGIVTIDQLKTIAASATPTLTTSEGEMLTVSAAGGVILLTDINGNKSYLEIGNIRQANGVIHVVNGVVIPTLG